MVYIQDNFGVRLINFGKRDFTGIAFIVEKLNASCSEILSVSTKYTNKFNLLC